MSVELGRVKNLNKNPVAEKAVHELEGEIAHQQPQGGAITHVTLAVATAVLDSRVRGWGLSAREMWTQRDQYTSKQMPVCDHKLITEQHLLRIWYTCTPTATSLRHITDTWL